MSCIFFFYSPLLFLTGAVFFSCLQADYETAFRLAIDRMSSDKVISPDTELKVVVNNSATLDAFKNVEMGNSLPLTSSIFVNDMFFVCQFNSK